MQRLFGIAAVMVAMLGTAQPAEACVCSVAYNPTRDQRLSEVRRVLEWADVVFVGEVVTTDRTTSTLSVDKVWKGAPLEKVRMRHLIELPNGDLQSSSCTKTFSSGRHLVFGKLVAPGLWQAGECGPTGSLSSKGEVLEFLDELCRTETLCTVRRVQVFGSPGGWQDATQPNIALYQRRPTQ